MAHDYEIDLTIRVGCREDAPGDLSDPENLAQWQQEGIEILTEFVDTFVGQQYRNMGGQFEIVRATAVRPKAA